jgi:hypothetical protein
LDRFVLDLEHKHGLIAEGKTLDIKAAVKAETNSAPSHNGNGKGNSKELLSATVG